ncbi:hypothetical protein WT57_11695 [Burkholderia pseudomultivorans]|uniref:Fis family transcriptional regulator n=2 Tax=Burkholderia pseudomultivorans TaxID=1207504 RepID=A0A132F4Y4_9BURK|nr:hypothetical protein WT57_11695 [Burkholderia pseudomultivorans]
MTLPPSPEVAAELALPYHLILEVLRTGCGSEDHIASMTQLTVKTMLVGESSGLKLEQRVFRDAREGIVRCRRSGRCTGTWMIDRRAYESLCEVLATYERQLRRAPFYLFMLAEEDVTALIGHRSSRFEGR